MTTRIKAIVFDMDGVLIEAKDWHYDALNRALCLFGMEISRYDHFVTYDGLPTRKKLKMLSMERGLPEQLHEFINDIKQQYTMEIVHARCKPVFFHEYALAKLKDDGYRMAVGSNSVRQTVRIMLEKANLMDNFEFVLSNEDVKQGKPDPEIYLTAMERLQVEPNECLVIEDNEKGLKAAYASGAHVMKVDTVDDVNYLAIKEAIYNIEERTT